MTRMPAIAFAALMTATVPTIAQASDSLNTVVSIDYRGTKPQEVLKALADAALLKLDVPGDEMTPVTLILTNARVRTALDAVCDNAGCTWEVIEGTPRVLRVRRSSTRPKPGLQAAVSLDLKPATFEQTFRSLASYLQMGITFEGTLPNYTVNLHVKGSTISALMDVLCRGAKCTWRLEPEPQRLVVTAK